jgi:hypothetical protein
VPGKFTLKECRRCSFLYLSPRPDQSEIGKYYPDTYGFYGSSGAEELSSFVCAMQQYDLERRSGGDLLDIGVAVGHFIAKMREHGGWNVRGLDLSATAVRRAHRVYGLTMDQGYLETAD